VKILICVFIAAVLIIGHSGIVIAEDSELDSQMGPEMSMLNKKEPMFGDEPRDEYEGYKEDSEPRGSLQYHREMRDLNREYEAGGLTKTEYVQRKREIEALYK